MALRGADPALIQDALYDAEEYLRSELAENPESDEATMLANVATSYGAPEEVAEIYRDKETQVESALRHRRPTAAQRRPPAGSSASSPIRSRIRRCSTCCWRWRPESSISPGRDRLLPVARVEHPDHRPAFHGAVHFDRCGRWRWSRDAWSRSMLGVRMPRRPLVWRSVASRVMARIKDMFTDPRTWSTLLYMHAEAAARDRYSSWSRSVGLSVSLALALSR